jgi:hypothetical protein
MSEAKSGWVHILRHLAVSGGVAAEGTGNYFLLRLTRRSERCRSGSQISGAGLYERNGATGRCRSVEGGWLSNGLKEGAFPALTLLNTPSVFIFCWANIQPASARQEDNA